MHFELNTFATVLPNSSHINEHLVLMNPYEPKYDTDDCLDAHTLDECVVRCGMGWSPEAGSEGYDASLSTGVGMRGNTYNRFPASVELGSLPGRPTAGRSTHVGGWPFLCR